MLCERGIRTHETAYRFTLDLLAIPALQEMQPPASHRRPEPRPGPPRLGRADVAGRRRGRRRRDHRRGSQRARRTRSATAPRRCPAECFARLRGAGAPGGRGRGQEPLRARLSEDRPVAAASASPVADRGPRRRADRRVDRPRRPAPARGRGRRLRSRRRQRSSARSRSAPSTGPAGSVAARGGGRRGGLLRGAGGRARRNRRSGARGSRPGRRSSATSARRSTRSSRRWLGRGCRRRSFHRRPPAGRRRDRRGRGLARRTCSKGRAGT